MVEEGAPRVMTFQFDNTYARELEGMYTPWKGATVPEPTVVALNEELAHDLRLDVTGLSTERGAAILVGSEVPAGASPLAQAYAGHQFGGFSPQLGDGRALLVGEIIDRHGERRDLHLKGSGRTPYSRGGDGKAVLGPVLREYLIGEAMHAMGVPTTRALAAISTGEPIMRQNGPEPGAVLARVASSHLRVGTFEFFSARGEVDKVRRLADYAIKRHAPHVAREDDPYLGLFRFVRERQAEVVAKWMSLGFIHGVMNTDNVTISGETIDYGPCAFMDAYDPGTVFSSIDRQGRYAYGNQPAIAQWNLARFVETLLPLIKARDTEHAVALATTEVEAFPGIYQRHFVESMGAKIGVTRVEDGDLELVNGLLSTLQGQHVDFTSFFRRLADAARGQEQSPGTLFDDPTVFDTWAEAWRARLMREPVDLIASAAAMDRVNPLYIPRNHKVEEALAAATAGDIAPFHRLLDILAHPFDPRADAEDLEVPAPDDFGPYRTFCGT